MTVCSCHVTYGFQSESTLYSWLNLKELLAQSRREIWSLRDCNWTRTHSHLIRKVALNHFAKLAVMVWVKWLSVRLRTKWLWIGVQLQSQKHCFLKLMYFTVKYFLEIVCKEKPSYIRTYMPNQALREINIRKTCSRGLLEILINRLIFSLFPHFLLSFFQSKYLEKFLDGPRKMWT